MFVLRYKAEVSCTDFDGRFFCAGDVRELDDSLPHSVHLVSVDKTALVRRSPIGRKKTVNMEDKSCKSGKL